MSQAPASYVMEVLKSLNDLRFQQMNSGNYNLRYFNQQQFGLSSPGTFQTTATNQHPYSTPGDFIPF